MKKNFPKKRLFALALAIVYLAIVAVVWVFQNRAASVDLTDLLQCSVDAAIDTVDYNVEPEALRIARSIVYMLGSPEKATSEELARFAKVFDTQEINVADRNGVIIASNLKENLGFDFKKSEQTADFAALGRGEVVYCCPKFRRSATGGLRGMWLKYVGMPFPQGGFVQVGHAYADFRRRLDYMLERLMNDYPAGEDGYYLLVDRQKGDIVSGLKAYMRGKMLIESGIDPKAFEDDEYVEDTVLPYHISRHPYPFDVLGAEEGETFEAFVYRLRLDFAPEMDVYVILSKDEVFYTRNRVVAMTAAILAFVFLVGGGLWLKVMQQHALVEQLREKEDRKRLQDLKMASNVQHAALPPSSPDLPNARLFAMMRPAKNVGGDFYDYTTLSDGRLLIVCADVSDKGIPAAMFMMRSKSVIRFEVEAKPTLVEAVNAANASLAAGNEDPVMFVTAWIGVLDLRTGEMEYVNAGHNPPYLRRADGTLEPLKENRGLVLAATDVARYRSGHVTLRPGDLLFLFTDGVTEAKSVTGGFYGEVRLERLLAEEGKGAPEEICRRVVASVDVFALDEPQADDITVLALTFG